MHKKEYSYGIIPLKKEQGAWQTLMIKHGHGHWAFPKGHLDPGEEPRQGAIRELKEETTLEIDHFLESIPFEEHYFYRSGRDLIEKRVTYFLAYVSGTVSIQQEELCDFKWVSLEEAQMLATFPETRKLCQKVFALLA